jgi:hypothetical protein
VAGLTFKAGFQRYLSMMSPPNPCNHDDFIKNKYVFILFLFIYVDIEITYSFLSELINLNRPF